jgi:catechol 2,3-dioxygenase-like lactoylglutathione lyase family enzyme
MSGNGGTPKRMFKGVDHVGVGVGDMDEALAFWGAVGFADVLFDYSGEVPGTERFTGAGARKARVVMLANGGATPVGPARVKLVQVLDGDGPPPIPEGQAWGELGICELCLHTRDVWKTHERLAALPGGKSLMEPLSGAVVPTNVALDISYVSDPWGCKLEMIEWKGLWTSLPGEPRAEGVNHVAFGVADMKRSLDFYRRMGFEERLFESTDFFDPMAPWYDRPIPSQHMVMMMSGQGAAIEPCVLDPMGPDCRGEWGHLGAFEFAVGVTNLERAAAWLSEQGVEVHDQHSVDVGPGEWRYAYLTDPDGLYVALVEPRF